MTDINSNNNNYIKRSKKPKPLFGIFRKTNNNNKTTDPLLGSGSTSTNIPIQSILSPIEQQQSNRTLVYETRPRSKSVGTKDPSSNSFQHQQQRLIEERESAFNKLCEKEVKSNPTSPSLVDSSLLLTPSYNKKMTPPVPPIPLPYQTQAQAQQQVQPPKMRKFSSAHDLRKAAKLQQETIFNQSNALPLPTTTKSASTSTGHIKRSRSLKLLNQQQQQKQQQYYHKMPITPNIMLMSKPRFPPFSLTDRNDDDDDDDDDIPLGFLTQQQLDRNSLLSDQEEEDDKDLIPIAATVQQNETNYQSAADKYKLKVKERLNLSQEQDDDDDDDDDDDLPISSFLK